MNNRPLIKKEIEEIFSKYKPQNVTQELLNNKTYFETEYEIGDKIFYCVFLEEIEPMNTEMFSISQKDFEKLENEYIFVGMWGQKFPKQWPKFMHVKHLKEKTMSDNFSEVWDRFDDRQFIDENNVWNQDKKTQDFTDIQEAVRYFESLIDDRNDEINDLKLKIGELENTVAQMQMSMINFENKINKKI